MTGTLHPQVPLAAGTRALVLGLGRTGLSAARYLDRKRLTVRVADTRANPPGAAALRAAQAYARISKEHRRSRGGPPPAMGPRHDPTG